MSRPCDRFETEGLLQLERGEPLDAHFTTCEDCLRARRFYARLTAELQDLDGTLEPPEDWRDKVRERVASQAPRPGRRPWPMRFAALFVLALGLGLWMRSAETPPTGLRVEIRSSAETTYRGDRAQPGDSLHLRAPADREYVELRVYRDDRDLVLLCTHQAPCRRQTSVIEARLVLEVRGVYRPVLLRSSTPLPKPTGRGLDADIELAVDSGATFELADEIELL